MPFFKVALLVLVPFLFFGCSQETLKTPEVKIVGAMKNVMRNGQLYPTINLDTIAQKSHLYGIGPLAYLKGEILIIDGKSYQATVVNDTSMIVKETYAIKAPFFGYTNIKKWKEHRLPESVETLAQLENYLNQTTQRASRPFMFKVLGTINQATIHIVNLPEGSTVHSPEEAHQGQVNYLLQNEKVEIIGFFSTEHKTIFTHHDTFLHMHLITKDRKKMGHLDALSLKKGTAKLYLPSN